MGRDPDHAYAVLHDQLREAFDDELRLKAMGEICDQVRDEFAHARQRVQALIDRVAARLEDARA